jgi:hypothetical protein
VHINLLQQQHVGWLQVDCTQEPRLCQEHQITGFPSIRVFRKGSDDITMHGIHEHEAYRGSSRAVLKGRTLDFLNVRSPG